MNRIDPNQKAFATIRHQWLGHVSKYLSGAIVDDLR
jgi:hypothetical protein